MDGCTKKSRVPRKFKINDLARLSAKNLSLLKIEVEHKKCNQNSVASSKLQANQRRDLQIGPFQSYESMWYK